MDELPDQPAPETLIDPGADFRGGEQAPTKRRPWSRRKVQTRATRADRRELRAADQRSPRS